MVRLCASQSLGVFNTDESVELTRHLSVHFHANTSRTRLSLYYYTVFTFYLICETGQKHVKTSYLSKMAYFSEKSTSESLIYTDKFYLWSDSRPEYQSLRFCSLFLALYNKCNICWLIRVIKCMVITVLWLCCCCRCSKQRILNGYSWDIRSE